MLRLILYIILLYFVFKAVGIVIKYLKGPQQSQSSINHSKNQKYRDIEDAKYTDIDPDKNPTGNKRE